jgi:O-antigen ligase
MGLFWLAALAVVVRFGYLHETLTMLAGRKVFLLYIVGVPALTALMCTGGLQRAFQGRPALYWAAFTAWMAIAIPFSTWSSGSLHVLITYMKVGPFMLLLIAGMTTNWRQCKAMMWALAAAAWVNLLTARLFQAHASEPGRLAMDLGSASIQNANDFAAHLLLVMPFLLWILLTSGSKVLKMVALLGLGYGTYLVMRAASRGAALALAIDLAFFLWRGTARQRVALLAAVPLAVAMLLAVVPHEAWTRMRTFSTTAKTSATAAEAASSAMTRQYLVKKGMAYTLAHPVFGVGPGQFAVYEDREERQAGNRGHWLVAHNSLMQVSSECGIPGLLLFLGGIISTFRLLNRIYREARRRPECHDIKVAVFCIMLALTGFCTTAAFLSFAYCFYLPAMGGLAVAVARGARQEFERRAAAPGGPGSVSVKRLWV